MTDRRCSLIWTVLTLALLAALPAAAAPAPATPAAALAAVPALDAAYAAIFAAPAVGTETGFTISVCCSATYCCELMPPSECDGMSFGSIFTCANRCSLC